MRQATGRYKCAKVSDFSYGGGVQDQVNNDRTEKLHCHAPVQESRAIPPPHFLPNTGAYTGGGKMGRAVLSPPLHQINFS